MPVSRIGGICGLRITGTPTVNPKPGNWSGLPPKIWAVAVAAGKQQASARVRTVRLKARSPALRRCAMLARVRQLLLSDFVLFILNLFVLCSRGTLFCFLYLELASS